MKHPRCSVGDQIKFAQYKFPWTVMANNRYFTICVRRLTGCLAAKKFMYTIVDWKGDVRGPDNVIFGPFEDYTTTKGAAKALEKLGVGRMIRHAVDGNWVWREPDLSVSRRRAKNLDFEKLIRAR